jgi:Skp family chaperone for outer membrane proteins
MNWLLIGIVSGGCLIFTVWWQHEAIGDMTRDLETERQEVAAQKQANLQLLTHIQDIKDLEARLDKFDADQKKRNQQLKGDLAKSLAGNGCAREPVPDATRELQRADVQRANDEIRAMYNP